MDMKKNLIRSIGAIRAICMLGIAGAFAQDGTDLQTRLENAPDFRFDHHKNGIGYGTCPVYTAPYEDALRLADGKAACATDAEMYDAGFDINGWLLVRYETNNGGVNTGYIPRKYVRDFYSQFTCKNFEDIPARATKTLRVTNNPLQKDDFAFAEIEAGESIRILAKYTYHGDWWYIECTVDGQPARGFIDRQTSGFVLGE